MIDSGLIHYEDDVVITDRDGNELGAIGDALGHVNPNWDIDRAGSKGQVEIEAQHGVLSPNMWIVPYRTYTPETGDIVRYPRGHFRLGKPSATYDGSYEMDTGLPASPQSARGTDIIDDIAAVALTETFYTPRRGNVMSDIRALIKIATMGHIGPNVLNNGSFEDLAPGTGWNDAWDLYENGASGSTVWRPSWGAAHGNNAWTANFNPSQPAGAQAVMQRYETVPFGARFVYAMGRSYRRDSNVQCRMVLNFRNELNQTIVGAGRVLDVNQHTGQWATSIISLPVPVNAVGYVLTVMVRLPDGSGGATSAGAWDDVRLGICTNMPLPDNRINLPTSSATATTRIQTTVTQSIGYEAINADRCTALGMHAIYTQQDGVITTSPLRNTNSATPIRTYASIDPRITSPVEIPMADGRVPNHFPAVKESFEEGVEPLYAEAWNDNVNDPYSVPNTGQVVSAPAIMVQDAVSQAALQAVAEAARDRHSVQEEVTFRIQPDPELTVYDVIEITDPEMPKAIGKWAIEYLGYEGPEMMIGARRAIGGG